MIPLHKLAELPRSQMLRKAASLFGEAESRLMQSGSMTASEAEYLGKVVELLSKIERFSETELTALNKAVKVLYVFVSGVNNAEKIHRTLNNIYYLLLRKTGRNHADWDFIESSGSLDASKRSLFPGMHVYLEDIRSPFNVGSMFRTAESFGVEKIWISPLCADPLHKRAERTAMGCIDVIPWERLSYNPFERSEEERQKTPDVPEFPFPKTQVFALETGGTPLGDFNFPPRGILIAGSEELGVSPSALLAADASLGRVSIPVLGAKGSLNVSVAFGIVMQAWAASLSGE